MDNSGALLAELLAGARLPKALDRAGRIELLSEASEALLAGKTPSKEAAMFLGGALQSWLQTGGDLERDYLKVRKRGSHRTVSTIWREAQSKSASRTGRI